MKKLVKSLWKVSVKCPVNVSDKDFSALTGIKFIGSFFLTTPLVMIVFDFKQLGQKWIHGSIKHAVHLYKFHSYVLMYCLENQTILELDAVHMNVFNFYYGHTSRFN